MVEPTTPRGPKSRAYFRWFWQQQDPGLAKLTLKRKPTQINRAREAFTKARTIAPS